MKKKGRKKIPNLAGISIQSAEKNLKLRKLLTGVGNT